MTKLDDTLEALASAFVESLDDLAATIAARQRREVAEHRQVEAPEMWEAVRSIARDSRHQQVMHFRHGRAIPSVCPPPDLGAARMAARAGVSTSSVHHAYQIAHDESWEAWFEAIERLDADDATRRGCRQAVSSFIKRYDQTLITLVTEEYDRQRHFAVNHDDDRAALIREVLDRSRDDLGRQRAYDLDLEHVGAVAWGHEPQRCVRMLATTLNRRSLTGEFHSGLVMAWLGGRSTLGASEYAELAHFKPPDGTSIAIGSPVDGVEGFRRTHRQAGEAHLVALRCPASVTLYSDVHLEVLALRDEQGAREFVADEFKGLDEGDARCCRLRATLRAYFAASQNARATAAALGVDEKTVMRHLRAVAEQTGRSVKERRAELELALRLHTLLRL